MAGSAAPVPRSSRPPDRPRSPDLELAVPISAFQRGWFPPKSSPDASRPQISRARALGARSALDPGSIDRKRDQITGRPDRDASASCRDAHRVGRNRRNHLRPPAKAAAASDCDQRCTSCRFTVSDPTPESAQSDFSQSLLSIVQRRPLLPHPTRNLSCATFAKTVTQLHPPSVNPIWKRVHASAGVKHSVRSKPLLVCSRERFSACQGNYRCCSLRWSHGCYRYRKSGCCRWNYHL